MGGTERVASEVGVGAPESIGAVSVMNGDS